VWAIWYVVAFFQAGHVLAWIAWQRLFTVMARILIVWLYNNTGKSVLAAILFHAMINISVSVFPKNGSLYDPAITGAITAVMAVIVTFFWGSKTLARYRYVRCEAIYGKTREANRAGEYAGKTLQQAAEGQADPGIAVALADHAHERQPPQPLVFLAGDEPVDGLLDAPISTAESEP
jgi:hypothetical protein